jgi:hypothetical protein
MSIFSSTVTDLYEWRLSYEWLLLMTPIWLTELLNETPYYNLVRTGNRTLPRTVCLMYCAYPLSGERVLIPGQPTHCVRNVLSEALSSYGLFQLSGFLTHALSCKHASTQQQPYVSKPLPSYGRFNFQQSCHNIILPSTVTFYKQSLSFKFSGQISVHISQLLQTCYMPCLPLPHCHAIARFISTPNGTVLKQSLDKVWSI